MSGVQKPTADWDLIGNGYYRRTQLYTSMFDPDLGLEDYTLSGAAYSGALALYRDSSKLTLYRSDERAKSTIDIYSYSGVLISRINWDKGNIKGLGWSEDERLLIISEDGSVRCYSNLSEDFSPFSLGQTAAEFGVVSCRFWLTGFVALLGNNQLISVTNYDEPRPKLLATPPSDDVFSWTVISPAYTLSKSVEALLAIGQTINVVDASDSEDRLLQNGPFRHISVSPNGRFIALYTDDSKVWVITTDFQEKLSEYETQSQTTPRSLHWCGNDAIVLAWEDEVHIVGPNGAYSRYYYDDWVHIVPDVDGVRIMTRDLCEFVQKIPDALEDVFKPGATSSAAVLLDALEGLENMSPKADSNIQLIKNDLHEAISTCVSAAGYEYSVHWQKQLLKAASYGKSAVQFFNSDDYVTMTKVLRAINAIRHHEIGMPISYEQFLRLNPDRLVQRLTNRQEYALALRIADFLGLSSSINRIYVHWAREKVRLSAMTDEVTCEQIVERLKNLGGISFEDIARAAYDEGRQNLATLLLDHELRAAHQVPLLLDMEEDTLALDKAIDSGDSDLILIVLLHIQKRLPLATFFRTVNTRPEAKALVEATARSSDQELLKDFYYQDDRRLDGANILVAESLSQDNVQGKTDKLRTALKLLQDSKDLATRTRLIEEAVKLHRLQDQLDADPVFAASATQVNTENTTVADRSRFAGLTLNATIESLILRGHHKRAQQIMVDFKVPERMTWWLRLRALVSARNWRELETIGTKTRKSPIGWEPFFTEILNAGKRDLAGNVFVAKCSNVSIAERADMYLKCGLVTKAVDEAVKAKDKAWLEEARSKVDARERPEIDRAINALSKGR